jgi:dUTP pyrophosphatase
VSGPVLLRVCRLEHGEGIALPQRASADSAGLDLRAAIPSELVVDPGERVAVPTGFALEIPPGWEGQVRPRSGLALRHGISLANAPGTIDADYRGELRVLLINLGAESFTVKRGDRIAQLLLAPVPEVVVEEVEVLADSERGSGGFGSTGRS